MAKRRFAPALRRAAIDPELAELKTLTVMGPGIIPATVTLGSSSIDRAAGWNLDAVVSDAYERSVWVYKSVELYATHASRLPIVLEEEEEQVVGHPLLRCLNVQANPLETGRAFKKRLAALALLSKRGAFVELTRSRAGVITRLDLLPPDRVRIVPDPHGDYIDYFEFTRPDGEVRFLRPENVLWVREPHPTDPFSGVTPLEAAGVSIELDHLSRIYNVSFIKRDARPGGILGVDTDQIDERELARIEKVFQPGAHHAGKITAIGTGPGGIRYIDTSARPRDMAYEHTSEKAKMEVLAAFGIPESMLGNTAGRTYDNAAQDEETFFGHFVNFLDLITDAFQRLVDGNQLLRYDTSSIEALELPKKRARAEAREEWNSGLRTLKEYRELRPELETIDNAHTRALWISPAKAPVPGRPEDAAELGLDTQAAGGQMPPGADPTMPTAPQANTADAMAEGQLFDTVEAAQAPAGALPPGTDAAAATAPPDAALAGDTLPPAPQPLATAQAQPTSDAGTLVDTQATTATTPTGDATGLLEGEGISAATGVKDDPQLGSTTDLDPAAGLVTLADVDDEDELKRKAELEGKARLAAAEAVLAGLQPPLATTPLHTEVKALANPAGATEINPPQTQLERAEQAIASALDALVARQVGVIKARVESPKNRRGTRFWTPETKEDPRAGDEGLDVPRIVAADRWTREVTETVTPILTTAATEAAEYLLGMMASSGHLVVPSTGAAPVQGRDLTPEPLAPEQVTAAAGVAGVIPALAAAAVAEQGFGAWLEDMIGDLDAYLVTAQPNLTEVLSWIDTEWAKRARPVVNSIALSAAQAAVAGGRDQAATNLVPLAEEESLATPTVERSWTTRGDERVRAAHAQANGQTRPVGEMFDVGGYELRWPSDPLAPASVARGCRCWLTYSFPETGRFTVPGTSQ